MAEQHDRIETVPEATDPLPQRNWDEMIVGLDAEPEPDTFGFSFVDMVSGGFGAAFFLFLIFSTLPLDIGSRGGGGDRFLQIWVDWNGGEAANVTLEPIIEFAPSESNDWLSYRMSTGRLRQTGDFGDMQFRFRHRIFWTHVFGAGFSDARSTAMTRIDENGVDRSGFWLHFSNPCPGRYRIALNRNAGFRDLLVSRERAVDEETPYNVRVEAPGMAEVKAGVFKHDDATLTNYVTWSASSDPQDAEVINIAEPRIKGVDLEHCE
ncbi:hypothetical protein [Phycobacter sp. K97]|uniref:hypothetical protein n=1 Tax=Phycobacter sedimenti TaxID=3133977 RepID=UPI00311DCA95